MVIAPLKPCPFCASHDVTVDDLGDEQRPFFAVLCNSCDATGPVATSSEGAIEAWNTRRESDGGQP